MRRIVFGLALVTVVTAAPSLAAAWHAGEVVVDGYRLPREHRFESPDASGKYNVVNINDVPGLIKGGRFVFDRTGNVWIKSPSGTMNSQYLAAASPAPAAPAAGDQWVVIDGYRLPREHRFESPDAGGTYRVVNINDVPGLIKEGRFVFDRTANVWIKSPSGTMNSQYLAAASPAPPAPAAPAAGDQWVVIDGYRLPREHRFESPDAGGTYRVVNINDVPGLIKEGRFVFDRTANVWIKSPSGTMNSQYLATAPTPAGTAPAAAAPAGSKWDRIRGTVQSVSGKTAVVRTDEGRNVTLDMSPAAPAASPFKPGDRVVAAGVVEASNRVAARYVREDRRAAAAADEGKWQHVHGRVQSTWGSAWASAWGSSLTVRADDGRVLNVEVSDVDAEVRRALSADEGVTLIGFPGPGNQFRAEYIQPDGTDASRAGQVPAAAPAAAAAVKEPPSQRLHGRVIAVAPTSIDFKSDEGSTMVVDLRQVDPAVVRSLRSGETVTVVGYIRDNGTRFDARDVLRDGSR